VEPEVRDRMVHALCARFPMLEPKRAYEIVDVCLTTIGKQTIAAAVFAALQDQARAAHAEAEAAREEIVALQASFKLLESDAIDAMEYHLAAHKRAAAKHDCRICDGDVVLAEQHLALMRGRA
jgi:hypothetical protein